MKKIIIEGGVGAGKSYICRLFADLGIPIFYSDIQAKKITDSNPTVIEKIKSEFGEDIYINNELNREAMSSIVFKDKEKLAILDSIVHPAVQDHFEQWTKAQELFGDCPYVIEESAIAIKNGIHKNFDYTIVVTADEKTRITRIKDRNNWSEEKILSIINSQISEQERIDNADFVIVNDSFPNAKCQVDFIHKILSEE